MDTERLSSQLAWVDTTRYPGGNKKAIPAKSFRLDVDNCIRITIQRSHHIYKGQWIINCDPFFALDVLKRGTTPLDDTVEPKDAQAVAMAMVRQRLADSYTLIGGARTT